MDKESQIILDAQILKWVVQNYPRSQMSKCNIKDQLQSNKNILKSQDSESLSHDTKMDAWATIDFNMKTNHPFIRIHQTNSY